VIRLEIYYICLMISRRSYSMFYNVQRIILLFFYTVTMITLSIPLAGLVTTLSPDHLYPLVVTLLLYMVGVVVLGSIINTISYIPFNLAAAFDPVKNAIASGEIRNVEELGKRITAFTTQFFDFAFLDIDHAFLHTGQTGPVSHEDLTGAFEVMEKFGMIDKSKQLEEIIRAGKIKLGNREFHLYILPIWFGEKWLGYMGLFSKKRISRFYQKFLIEFENNFLDDQLMYMIQQSR
jgi:hypothetical protein